MADAQAFLRQPALHLRVEIEQPHGVCHAGAAFAHLPGDVFLPQVELGGQPVVRPGLLHYAEVRALEVFDQREFEHLAVRGLAHDGGRVLEFERLGRPPAAFPRDQFVMVADLADDQRLDDPLLADRIDEFMERFGLELLARLKGAALDLLQLELLDGFTWRRLKGRGGRAQRRGGAVPGAAGRAGLDQRTQAASESDFCHPSRLAEKRGGTKVNFQG